MSSTWPNEALWVNYWSPKSADPRVWQGNDHDNNICKKCGLVMPRWNIRDTNVLGAMQFFGKCNVFTFCPAAVDLFGKKLDASHFRHGKESNQYWMRPFLNFHGQLLHFSDLLVASPIISVPMKTLVFCIITMRKYWWFRLSTQARHKCVLGIRFFTGRFGHHHSCQKSSTWSSTFFHSPHFCPLCFLSLRPLRPLHAPSHYASAWCWWR